MPTTPAFLLTLATLAGLIAGFGLTELVTNAGASQSEVFGDVDCDGSVNSLDGLKILRHSASLGVIQNEPCPDIGSTSTPTPSPVTTPTPGPSPTPIPPENGGRLISLGTIHVSGGEVKFPLANIGDCARISVLASSDGNGALAFPGQPQFLGYTSPDGGATLISVQPTSWGTILQGGAPGAVTFAMDGAAVALPNLRLALEAIDSNITASIWCQQ